MGLDDRTDEFRRELETAPENSDLWGVLQKVAFRVDLKDEQPNNPQYNWFEAQRRVLEWTDTQPIRNWQTLSQYVTGSLNGNAWTCYKDNESPGTAFDHWMFVQNNLADHVMHYSSDSNESLDSDLDLKLG